MSKHRDWEGIRTFIANRKKLIITTHVNPDGDAIGSEIAMSIYLRSIGKSVFILNSSPTPKFYRFLDPDNIIRVFDNDKHIGEIAGADGCIVLDISDWKRLRTVGQALRDHNISTVCIDHHMLSDRIGDVQVMDDTASSTGEMLYDFFSHSGIEINEKMANALYTCVLTDTGSFRFSNTTPNTHHVAAALIEKGADFRRIYREVYESYSVGRVKLMGQAWDNMHFDFGNRLAWYTITQKMMRDTSVDPSEIEGFSELPRIVEGVEVSLLFTELTSGKIKISLRSKGLLSIHEVALEFKGGGHKFAAGAVIDGPLESAQKRVLAKVRGIFDINQRSLNQVIP
jgi:nanoRNase/pAp phosphatase (c-di-AMP/oligoRNAs hydrolase)